MIDRLELTVPDTFAPHPDVWSPLNRKKKEHVAKSSAYAFKLDCRAWGFWLFYGHRHPVRKHERHYRVVYDAVRLRTSEDICRHLEWFFGIPQTDVSRFRVARLDFAVNVPQPVEWFRQNMYVKDKQELNEFIHQRTTKVETLVFGKSPDRYIVYDKVRERLAKGKPVLQLGMLPGQPLKTTTRVERRCEGSRVPVALRTLGAFLENAASFDPFTAVGFLPTASAPDTTSWTANPEDENRLTEKSSTR